MPSSGVVPADVQYYVPLMQHLSTDGRPEVRNSGVRTLFSVVVSHGAHLSQEQWQHCWWSMLFPLLRTVHHMSTTSSREEVHTRSLATIQQLECECPDGHDQQQMLTSDTVLHPIAGTGGGAGQAVGREREDAGPPQPQQRAEAGARSDTWHGPCC